MNESQQIDPIDQLLRQQDVYVEDRGFTAHVMKALPHRQRAWLSPAILLSAAAIGSVLSLFWVPWRNLPALNSPDAPWPNPHALLPWSFALAVAGSLVWCAMVAVLQSGAERR